MYSAAARASARGISIIGIHGHVRESSRSSAREESGQTEQYWPPVRDSGLLRRSLTYRTYRPTVGPIYSVKLGQIASKHCICLPMLHLLPYACGLCHPHYLRANFWALAPLPSNFFGRFPPNGSSSSHLAGKACVRSPAVTTNGPATTLRRVLQRDSFWS